MSPAGARNDPYRNFNFLVEIDGVTHSAFLSVEGIESLTEVVDYRNGDEQTSPRRLPGLTKCSDITLKRGLTKDLSLWQWYRSVIQGRTERHSGSVTILDEARQPVFRVTFREAWPNRWALTRLDAQGKETLLEEISIVVESLDVEVA